MLAANKTTTNSDNSVHPIIFQTYFIFVSIKNAGQEHKHPMTGNLVFLIYFGKTVRITKIIFVGQLRFRQSCQRINFRD